MLNNIFSVCHMILSEAILCGIYLLVLTRHCPLTCSKRSLVSKETTPVGERVMPTECSVMSISHTNISYLYSAVVAIFPFHGGQTKVTPLCLFSLSTPQSVSAGIVIKWRRSFIHAGLFWVTFHFVGVYLHLQKMESMKQRMLVI